MTGAAQNWHLAVVQWLYSEFEDGSTADLFNSHSKGKDDHSTAMDAAACNGHLDILQYLHGLEVPVSSSKKKRKRKSPRRQAGPTCTKRAMDEAAGNNFLDVVQ